MSESRLPDYLDHMQQAATDACAFVQGLGKTQLLKPLPVVRQDADKEGRNRERTRP